MIEKCEICNWEGFIHSHHIIPKSEGGSLNDPLNLINLCPNHHSEATFDWELFNEKYNLIGIKESEERKNELREISKKYMDLFLLFNDQNKDIGKLISIKSLIKELSNNKFFNWKEIYLYLSGNTCRIYLNDIGEKGLTREKINEMEFKELLNSTRKKEHKLIFKLAYVFGLKVSEILELHKGDIDLEKKEMLIYSPKHEKLIRIIRLPFWFGKEEHNLFPIKVKSRALEASFIRNSFKSGINSSIGTFTRNGKEVPVYRFSLNSLRISYLIKLREFFLSFNIMKEMVRLDEKNLTKGFKTANLGIIGEG